MTIKDLHLVMPEPTNSADARVNGYATEVLAARLLRRLGCLVVAMKAGAAGDLLVQLARSPSTPPCRRASNPWFFEVKSFSRSEVPLAEEQAQQFYEHLQDWTTPGLLLAHYVPMGTWHCRSFRSLWPPRPGIGNWASDGRLFWYPILGQDCKLTTREDLLAQIRIERQLIGRR